MKNDVFNFLDTMNVRQGILHAFDNPNLSQGNIEYVLSQFSTEFIENASTAFDIHAVSNTEKINLLANAIYHCNRYSRFLNDMIADNAEKCAESTLF